MKKLLTTICLLGLITLLVSGCGSSGGTGSAGTSGASGSDLCTDVTILSKLKNDDSPEFVLDGEYYSLPISATEFTVNGWDLTIDDYEGQEVILQPQERIGATLTKDGNTVSVVLANDSELPLEAEISNVIEVRIYVSESEGADFLVTKYGITGTSTSNDVKSVLQDKEGFKEQSGMYYLVSDGEFGSRDILYFSNNNGYTSIKIASAEDWVYSLYKPLEQKAQEQADKIAARKKEVEEGCPENYDDIVQEIMDATSLHTVPFYSIDGTIIAKTSGRYEGTENNIIFGQELFIYIVQDSSGQYYAINEGFSEYGSAFRLPELNEGDVISLWGFAREYATSSDGYTIPSVIPEIVEKDGETIYLSDQLQVN